VLHENDLTDFAIKDMTTKVALKLHTIDLNLNRITNQGIKYLCLAYWPCLSVLNLQDNLFNAKGISSFLDSKW
jgi:Ran GTPase-activating protein (RanGAP) involved in mRNA processing and transport